MTIGILQSRLFGDMFGTAAMRAVFDDRAFLARCAEVEAALARAQARLGIVPEAAAEAITAAAAADPATFDLDRLKRETETVGYPILPLVRQLAEKAGEAGRWLHWGATTQDIMDTAAVLQIRDGLALIAADLDRARGHLADLARRWRDAPMAGRTHLQHALPITFGFKAAVWLSSVLRHAERVRAAVARPIPGEFAGAAGTLASLQEQGLAVRRAFMRRLRLPEPTITWAAMRDEVFVRVAALAGLTNSLAKIAQDIAELGSTEIGEVAEPHAGGKDTSSTLPLTHAALALKRAVRPIATRPMA